MIAKKGLLKIMVPVVALAITVGACAGPRAQYIPYPSKGTSPQQHETNIAVCERYARGQPGASSQRGLNEGARGAVGLGLLGAVLGALAGDARLGGFAGAAIGATGGAVYGSQQAQRFYDMAFNDCMSKR